MWASLVAQRAKRLPAMWETWVPSLGWEDPLENEWQLTPVLLPGESRGWRSLLGYSSWGHKESDMTERLHFVIVVLSAPFDNTSSVIKARDNRATQNTVKFTLNVHTQLPPLCNWSLFKFNSSQSGAPSFRVARYFSVLVCRVYL